MRINIAFSYNKTIRKRQFWVILGFPEICGFQFRQSMKNRKLKLFVFNYNQTTNNAKYVIMKLKTVVYAFAKYNEHWRSYASDSHWPYALSR